jgi:hypothetical protein
MGVRGQRHAQAAIYARGKDSRYTLDRKETAWNSELVWTKRIEEKSFSSAGDRNRVLQSAVRHVSD